MNIHPTSILAMIILAHLVADYTLQGWLADGKQKAWWNKLLQSADDHAKRKYRNDYKAALVCHSLYWSLLVNLPILTLGCAYSISVLFHAALHYIVDDAKANRFAINLVQDQLAHLFQIVAIWVTWLLVS